MALPLSGPISMSQINSELSIPATTTISLNQSNARALAQVPAGLISLSNFYGKSASVNGGIIWGKTGPTPAPNAPGYSAGAIVTVSFATETYTEVSTNTNAMVGTGIMNTPSYALMTYGFGAGATPITLDKRIQKTNYATNVIDINLGTNIAPNSLTTAYNLYDESFGYFQGMNLGAAPNNVGSNLAYKISFATLAQTQTSNIPIVMYTASGVTTPWGMTNPTIGLLWGTGPAYIPTQTLSFTYATGTYIGPIIARQPVNDRYTVAINRPAKSYTGFGNSPPAQGPVNGARYITSYVIPTNTLGTVGAIGGTSQAIGCSTVTSQNFSLMQANRAIIGTSTPTTLQQTRVKLKFTLSTETTAYTGQAIQVYAVGTTQYTPPMCGQPASISL